MVAKSYQSFEVVSDVYTIKGRAYIKVKNPKNGNTRQVRWYTENEYRKMYPGEAQEAQAPEVKRSIKDVLGFTKGYITIFKGDTYSYLEWFKASICRYAKSWGWYVISTEEVPEDLPYGIEPIQLSWDAVGTEDGTLKTEAEVQRAIDSLLYEDPGSEFQGEIGQRLDLIVTIRKALIFDGHFGTSTLHTMEDDAGNVYTWITSSKTLQEGETYHMRGTVKDHRTFKNCQQTILTNCRLVKN